MKHRTIQVILAVLLITTFASCQHKELCYDHSHGAMVRVIFDWTEAPDADPETMSLYLFPKQGGDAMRYEFIDNQGGTISIPVGEYEALCLNSDTESVSYRNMNSRQTFEVFGKQSTLLAGMTMMAVRSEVEGSAPRPLGTEDEQIMSAPERMWSDHLEGVEIKEVDGQGLTLTPQLSTSQCSIQILNVDNLEHVNSMSGVLTGTSGSFYPGLGSDVLGSDVATIPFSVTLWPDKNEVTGSLEFFGHCHESTASHMLSIYAIMSDGSKYTYTFDVSDQMHDAVDQRNIQIVIDGLQLQKPIYNGNGFQPTVDDWNNTQVDIEM